MSEKKTKKFQVSFHAKIVGKWLIAFSAIFFIAMAGVGIFAAVYENSYSDKIFKGVYVGGVDLSGKTTIEAQKILKEEHDAIMREGVKFQHNGEEAIIPSELLGSDPDLSKRIIEIDISSPLNIAYEKGRKSGWIVDGFTRISFLVTPIHIPINVIINEAEIGGMLREKFGEIESPARNANIRLLENGRADIIREEAGRVFHYGQAIADLKSNLAMLKNEPIALQLEEQLPVVAESDVLPFLKTAEKILATTSPEFVYENKKWSITKDQARAWMEVGIVPDGDSQKKKIGLKFNEGFLFEILEEIAKEINVEPKDAKFELNNNRVTQFQASRTGKALSTEENYHKINRQYFEMGNPKIPLTVSITPPKVATADANDLGITTLLGEGRSNFAGSPHNRRVNIANGVRLLNGILIPPGEEMSLIKALAPFNGENGYVQELVIKGDRTIPEYGGGLCQIGTTAFRAALHSGLKITERRNHSYRVVYYEPAGMDATIYEPAPDFKFVNDTPGYILFIAEVEGDELVFKFYGTDDGREAIVPDRAVILSTTPPGEPRFIETDQLAPGEKQLVERPHAGAHTVFDYVVKYADGTTHKETYESFYVPWRETWLVGKDPNTPAEGEEDGEENGSESTASDNSVSEEEAENTENTSAVANTNATE